MVNKILKCVRVLGVWDRVMGFWQSGVRCGAAMAVLSVALLGCGVSENRQPFPLQGQVCAMFDETEHMREYWIGIQPHTGAPDVKVRIPSEYMDFRLRKITKAKTLDGAIGFGLRPLDFAPSRGYVGVMEYPDGPIKPDDVQYKRANGWLLIKHPSNLNEGLRFAAQTGAPKKNLKLLLDESTSTTINEDLRVIANTGHMRRTHDLMAYAPEHEVLAYFLCAKRERENNGLIQNGGCRMFSNYGPVSYTMNFDRDFLPEWKTLHRKAEDFINCMIIETKDKESQ